ncbi:hypothetical protein GDO78_007768 [Eleutherodactylus coqui]|uniref:PH domain-containing protein n=1 Tax=Eleutherodactylus coqui TaxID=57060 RepID=A0A8J6FK63_ELECQ|nr:hypothetical protein GDO78_007768 [Eleutherodactylus coqui]
MHSLTIECGDSKKLRMTTPDQQKGIGKIGHVTDKTTSSGTGTSDHKVWVEITERHQLVEFMPNDSPHCDEWLTHLHKATTIFYFNVNQFLDHDGLIRCD